MADRYLAHDSGRIKEKEAADTSVGAADAGKMIALNTQGKLDNSMLPTGIGADTAAIEASEGLSAGDFINIYDDSGPKVRKADATAYGKEASGFVLTSVTSGNTATVYFEGGNNQLSGLTVGVTYLSADTPGSSTSTPPSGLGNIVQRVGTAVSATTINVEFGQPIEIIGADAI
jgi:hypothetical protein